MLTAKLGAKLSATNQVPHHPFGVCLSSPQRACERKQLGRSLLEWWVDPTHVDPIGVSRPTSLQPGEISTHYRAPAPDAGHTLDERQRDLPAEMPRTTCRPRRNPQAGSLIFPLSPWERVRVRVFRSRRSAPPPPSPHRARRATVFSSPRRRGSSGRSTRPHLARGRDSASRTPIFPLSPWERVRVRVFRARRSAPPPSSLHLPAPSHHLPLFPVGDTWGEGLLSNQPRVSGLHPHQGAYWCTYLQASVGRRCIRAHPARP